MRARSTIAPPIRVQPEEAADLEGSETQVVDDGYLERMMAPDPPPRRVWPPPPPSAEEIAAEPLPAPREVGGYVVSAEYMRLIVVYARRERQRRLGPGHP